jgi:AraC-like DNA-binding protein
MDSTRLVIKNMVCQRCITSVEQTLNRLAIPFTEVSMGNIHLQKPLADKKSSLLSDELQKLGFEIIDDKKKKLIEKIKFSVQSYLKKIVEEESRKNNLSDFIHSELKLDYSYLSDLFSSIEGITIEQYFIRLRIEKVKELVVYDELSFSEIADRVGFSSIHHLSAQFKKTTGMTLSHFKNTGKRHSSLDKI